MPKHRGEIAEREDLGQRLQAAREYIGLSQGDVAEALEIPRASVSAFETGKRKVSFLELKKLCKLYRRPLSYFGDESGPGTPSPDSIAGALFRATESLSEEERMQVLKFAEFLKGAGAAPKSLAPKDR